jgi:alkylation response protein AidB-like acyl-CoA dehydrogenase
MDFGFNDEQRAIKDTAREMLASRCPLPKVREAAEARSYDGALWDEIRQLGWTGIAIPEEHGGQGLGVVELVILCEELGYGCAPSPFLSTAAAGLLIAHAGTDDQRRRWLPGIASGEITGAAAATPGDEVIVSDADDAAVIVLPDGDGARLVTREDAKVESLETIDATRRFARVSADGGEPLPGDVAGAIGRVIAAVSAELTGVAQRAMEMAVAYAKERHQFDRPIGSYQAVSHRCAEMLYDTEEARSLTYYAAWCADAQGAELPVGSEDAADSLPLAASMAKARASEAAWRVSASALQVHGGIGFTWEHDLHFLLKRAKVGAELYGDPRQHRERVATLAGLG